MLSVAAVATFVVNNYGLGPLWAGWQNIELPFRIARLMAEPPDRNLTMPVAGVSVRRVADTWHARRGRARRHEGQDIFAPRGTPVVAAASGVIVHVGENRLGGHTVSVLGAGGRTYYYAHLDRYVAADHIGADVGRGTVIGYVGNTGNARTTPPHLHFGVYTASGPIDPLPLLAAKASG